MPEVLRECLKRGFHLYSCHFAVATAQRDAPYEEVRACAPCSASAYLVHLLGFFLRPSRMRPSTIWNSGLSVEVGSGIVPSFAYAFSALAPSAPPVQETWIRSPQVSHACAP